MIFAANRTCLMETEWTVKPNLSRAQRPAERNLISHVVAGDLIRGLQDSAPRTLRTIPLVGAAQDASRVVEGSASQRDVSPDSSSEQDAVQRTYGD